MATRRTPGGECGEIEPAAIIVCDRHGDAVRRFLEDAAAAGTQVRWVTGTSFIDAIDLPSAGSIGLVRLTDTVQVEQGFDAIRLLAAKGAHVIAYGDDADRWPIGARCRALLAGAGALLDSAQPDFVETLRTKVTHECDMEAQRRREHEDIRLTFRNLGIVGESDASGKIFRWISRISRLSDLHTLITGETGTGKQLVAEATHRLDPKRRDGPFVVLNCAAISPSLAESELFGHRRGSFTGADRDRKGLVRAAHGGVLFLDEIGELDMAHQAKLLRVVQDGRVLGVGEDHESAVDVRVIAATNRDLDGMVRQRRFRADLYHRLTVLSVHIPPLRERPADIVALVDHFLVKHQNLRGGVRLRAGDDFVSALARADLPGNARQVENIVRRAIVRKDDDLPLGLSDLPPEIWWHVSQPRGDGSSGHGEEANEAQAPAAAVTQLDSTYLSRVLAGNGWNLARSLDACERSLVEVALRAAHGNQSKTARLLGITPRCVYKKLRKHQLSRSKV